MEHDDTVANLTAAWDLRGIDVTVLQFDRGTAVAHRDEAIEPSQIGALPSLLARGPSGARAQFELGDVLGEGGMGVVLTAHQTSLDRDVAVKRPKPEVGRVAGGGPQLLREGRVTGVLEHPNVVPIYALGRDDDDLPLLVMKRIEGRAWTELLEEVGGTRDDAYLRTHLIILKQVALATHFAHSRGVIHRDLKPDNVMIGGFGEVYVVDWGIAVASGKVLLQGVPLAAAVDRIEGTPAYLAPEMAAGDGEHIDERSDVYLLGAMLHQIMTGLPPHGGDTIIEVLTAAFTSEPKVFAADVPRDLAEVCNKAMARDPGDRFASALAFADAIDEFIVHRASTHLSDEATIQLAVLRELFEAPAAARDAERMYATFSACRFAFQQALRSWSGNDAAEDGLQETLELMIAFELDRDTPQTAAALFRELPRPNAELKERVAQESKRKRSADERLAKLAREADLTIGQAARQATTLVVASLFGISCVAFGVLTRQGIYEVGHFAFAMFNLGVAGLVTISAALRRDDLLANVANRRLTLTAQLVFASYAALWLLADHLDLAMADAATIHCFIGVVLWTLGSISVEKKWAPIPIGSAFGLTATLLAPAYYFEWIGLFAFAGSAAAVVRYMKAYEE